jgi:hypothetical protein
MNRNAANPEYASTSRRTHDPPMTWAWRVAAVIAAACLAMVAAACGGSSGSSGVAGAGSSTPSGQSSSSSSRSDQLLAFSHCMRSHGASGFPDPEPGQTDIKLPPANEGIYGVSGSRLWPAVSACRHLLPPGQGAWYPRSEIPRVLRGLRRFAECMRSHGILDWPDPKFDSQGRLGFTGPGADNPPGSRTDHVVNQCHHLLPSEVTNLLGVG